MPLYERGDRTPTVKYKSACIFCSRTRRAQAPAVESESRRSHGYGSGSAHATRQTLMQTLRGGISTAGQVQNKSPRAVLARRAVLRALPRALPL